MNNKLTNFCDIWNRDLIRSGKTWWKGDWQAGLRTDFRIAHQLIYKDPKAFYTLLEKFNLRYQNYD